MKRGVYKKGYFPVTDGHELYYELYGNPKGIPIVFVHGGPGAGFTPKHRKFFDSHKHNVLFYDQRGAGKSKPFASVKNNTTWKLVEDMKKLIENFFGKKKVYLMGGSWGSTLSLVYAINHPENVKGMVLRGIYLATKEENKHYTGGGVGNFFPEVWEEAIKDVPKKYHKDIIKFYHAKNISKSKKIRNKFAYAWTLYELNIASLVLDEKKNKKIMKKKPELWKGMSPLETTYIAKNCFLPNDYIMKNIGKIRHLPVSIINGRYDMICPPISAYKLHKALPKSKLFLTLAGHLRSEPANRSRLAKEIKRLCK
ncbi:prolyl aminopeptidase [Candidatus Woesearchaeota archaeon]|nr:prolyl aminopeptidase [Candidatus Woesearchaeota archaeon]